MVTVHGTCAAGFEGVRKEFERNFTERGDLGAAVAATKDGELVVDLWAGSADVAGTRPWQRDTLVNVYSTSKGLTSLCAHLLADRGELDLDAPVARYWPEFARAGKAALPVRMLLSHRAGLIGPAAPMTTASAYDWDAVCESLAATEPWWEPGTAQGYHALTFGFLVGELVRRISGQSLGTFLRKELTEPLGADCYVGTPVAEQSRCAELSAQLDRELLLRLFPDFPTEPARSLAEHPLTGLQVALTYIPVGDVNSAAFRSAELPAANAHATARGLATVYRALATGGLLGAATVERMRTKQSRPGEPDRVIGPLLQDGARFGWTLGFMSNSSGQAGPNPLAFGHGGAGGSYAFADPENRVSYAYTTNRFAGGTTGGDPRSIKLVGALYSALAR